MYEANVEIFPGKSIPGQPTCGPKKLAVVVRIVSGKMLGYRIVGMAIELEEFSTGLYTPVKPLRWHKVFVGCKVL